MCVWAVQLKTAPLAILGAFVTIIVASIIPALRGADMDQNGAGPFTKVMIAICQCDISPDGIVTSDPRIFCSILSAMSMTCIKFQGYLSAWCPTCKTWGAVCIPSCGVLTTSTSLSL